MKSLRKKEIALFQGGEVHFWPGGFTICHHVTSGLTRFLYGSSYTKCTVYNNDGKVLMEDEYRWDKKKAH